MKRKVTITESDLKNIIKKQLMESLYGNETTFQEEKGDNDGRLSDMNIEDDDEQETRDSIETFFKQDGVNTAAYAYQLYHVKAVEGEDTDEMKNARSKFAKCLNHEKNEAGYPYSFTSAELNTLKGMISSNQLNESIRRAVNETFKRLNEGQYDESPITKWVYWCFNYHYPQEWIPQLWGTGAMGDHMMKKFSFLYEKYGSNAVMNRFFVELDQENQQKLIDYVMNNY